jgi:hypothetical protein
MNGRFGCDVTKETMEEIAANKGHTTNEVGTPRASEVCEEFTHLGS